MKKISMKKLLISIFMVVFLLTLIVVNNKIGDSYLDVSDNMIIFLVFLPYLLLFIYLGAIMPVGIIRRLSGKDIKGVKKAMKVIFWTSFIVVFLYFVEIIIASLTFLPDEMFYEKSIRVYSLESIIYNLNENIPIILYFLPIPIVIWIFNKIILYKNNNPKIPGG